MSDEGVWTAVRDRPDDAARLTAPVSDRVLQRRLIEALYEQRLPEMVTTMMDQTPETFSDDARVTLRRTASTCTNIANEIEAERARVLAHLRDAGIGAKPEIAGNAPQHHKFAVRIAGGDLGAAYDAVTAQGYVPQRRFSPGALSMLRRSAAAMTFMRMDAVTSRMTLRWRTSAPSWGPLNRCRPGRDDLAAVALPRAMWPLYAIVRPWRRASPPGLPVTKEAQPVLGGGFLGTPTSLIRPLLDTASLTSDDTLLDVGCGDGRIIAEAHRHYGCRARGVERSGRLVDIAKERCAEGISMGSVEVFCGEASEVDPGDATVVFMFLPKSVLGEVLLDVLERLSIGARLIVHEQDRLVMPIEPDESVLVLADAAITVAHVWRRTSRDRARHG
jgi:SAM-dependent methyltransferase